MKLIRLQPLNPPDRDICPLRNFASSQILPRSELFNSHTKTAGMLWVEKISLKTEPLVQVSAGSSSVVDELGSLLAEGAQDPELKQKLLADLSEFLGRIPSDLATEDDLLFAVRQGETEDLLAIASAALTARLEGEAK
jgi:hypothetical protein